MKRVYLLFLILTVLLNCSLVKSKIIPDKNLAAAVREQLSLDPNEPILEKDLRALKDLFAMHRGIKDLTGLEKATNYGCYGLRRTKLETSRLSLI